MKDPRVSRRRFTASRGWLAPLTLGVGLSLAGCGLELAEPLDTELQGLSEVADPAAYKASHDTAARVPLSGTDQAAAAKKEQQARAAYEAKLSGRGDVSPLAQYASRYLGNTQQGQQTSYWCGPASAVEALALKGVSMSQSDAATMLRTTTDGTAFSGVNAAVPSPTGYPIRDVLNYKLNTSFYVPVWLPYTPSATDISNFKSRMTFDIDNGWPTIGNAWEAPGGPHLAGHPANLEIFHWITINGYGSWGDTTSYEDSATTVWSSVPAYTSGFNTNTMVTILGGRGYIW